LEYDCVREATLPIFNHMLLLLVMPWRWSRTSGCHDGEFDDHDDRS
jgi:hypothetical protein